jgi:hypothetical protein
VGWNELGQPINPNGSMFVSYIGAVVREHIPITLDCWRPKDKSTIGPAKDFIWSEIQVP